MSGDGQANVTVRVPKRILHFSDGTLEEYSDTEPEDNVGDEHRNTNVDSKAVVDTSTMTWGPWLWYTMARTGSSALEICDSVGERLAYFFGITSAKYAFEIEEFRRLEEERKQMEMEQAGWQPPAEVVATEQPLNSPRPPLT